MIFLSRKYRFSAAHRLYCPALSDERNREIYGKCANPYGHGHDYEVEVTAGGEVNAATGRVIDVAELDALVDATVLKAFRYKNLNEEIAEFQQMVPTTENLALVVDRRLRVQWAGTFGKSGPALEKVRIWETDRNICEISHGDE